MGETLLKTLDAAVDREEGPTPGLSGPTSMDDGRDFLRIAEYPQMLGNTYLDHAGTTPWARSLTHGFTQLMSEELYGNPHSGATPSRLTSLKVDACRKRALLFFNADPDHFDLIFLPNATGAIKLVHDCFKDYSAEARRPWWYGYHKDSHTSLVGVREGATKHRCFRSDLDVELWIQRRGLGGADAHEIGLFAYPGQSNMTGKRFPLDWATRIRQRIRAETYTLLDAAALASTAEIDLSDHAAAPDFIALSFYKIFGFPHLGALIVRKTAARALRSRKYFGGGTVDMVVAVKDSWVARKTILHSRLEDGTLPFLSIFALHLAMDIHCRLYGSRPMKFISLHTSRLCTTLYNELAALRHMNGTPVVVFYKDKSTKYGDPQTQGATIALNIQTFAGSLVNFQDVEREADKQDIYLRSGSLCNPGGLATYLGWSPRQLYAAFANGHRCSEPQSEFDGKFLGVLRVSLGAMSNERDVYKFVRFVKETYVDFMPEESTDPARSLEDLTKESMTLTATMSETARFPSFDVPGCVLQVAQSQSPQPRPPCRDHQRRRRILHALGLPTSPEITAIPPETGANDQEQGLNRGSDDTYEDISKKGFRTTYSSSKSNSGKSRRMSKSGIGIFSLWS